MPVALDSIYLPLREFFVKRFASLADASVQFRFDLTPARFADSDFVLAQRPTDGASAVVADERLAALVDGVPLYSADGRTVELGPRLLSELYRDEIVGPAVPLTDDGASAQREAFEQLKVQALARLEQGRRASVLGTGATFHPVTATPARWWDRHDQGVWTAHRFEVGGAYTGPAPAARSSFFATLKQAFGGKREPALPTVSAVTISFDFCVVEVARPWLSNSLLAHRAWCIPGQNRGRYSANDGVGMPAVPIGFLAIRNLRITAPWSATDVSLLEQSDQFGPFAFDAKVVDGAIGHSGIQIIGWLLQDMQDLPPADEQPKDDIDAVTQAAGLTNKPPYGLPSSPPSRQGKPIPFVDRLDDARFRALALGKQTSIVFVSAAWDGWSRQMERVVEMLAREHRDVISFAELDTGAGEPSPVLTAQKIDKLPTFLVIQGGQETRRIIGAAAPDLIEVARGLRYGPRKPTSGELRWAFMLGTVLCRGGRNSLCLDNLQLFGFTDRIAQPSQTLEALLALTRELSTTLGTRQPLAARALEAGVDLELIAGAPSQVAGDLIREFVALATAAGLPPDSLERLLTPVVAADPSQRRELIANWIERENLPFAKTAWSDREAPLCNVPRLTASELAVAVGRRDTLVYFSDTSNGGLHELDAMTQAISALYGPKFQTVEVAFFANYELAKSVGAGIPGTYVAYRRGVAVGHVSRPSRWEDLVTDIGLA